MLKSEFVPLSEAIVMEHDRVDWRLELPEYVPAENIGINLSRLGKLARLGGFNHLHVVGFSGDTTEVQPTIVGSDGNGNAMAGMKATQNKASIQRTRAGQIPADVDADYYWNCGIVGVNLAEASDRLSNQGQLRGTQAWSKLIDTALKDSVKAVAVDNLVHKQSMLDKASPVLLPMIYYGIGSAQGLEVGTDDILSSTVIYQTVINPMFGRMFRKMPLSDYRWSVVPGVSLDRVLAVSGLASASRLTKTI